MRIAIVGSRDFKNLKLVEDYVKSLPKDTIIVSGGARGVDKVAENTAISLDMKVEICYPDWKMHGKKAGILRNKEIVMSSDLVVAFHNGISKGTQFSIDYAIEIGRPIITILDNEVWQETYIPEIV